MPDPKQPTPSARAYFRGSIGVIFSRGIGILAGVGSLWILTRVLDTEQFAGYMLAMSVVQIIGFFAGFGIERVLFLKISALTPDPQRLHGQKLAARIAVWVSASAVVAVLATLLLVGFFPELTGQTALAHWLTRLAPIGPAIALITVLVAWLEANHRTGRPQALQGEIDASRCAGFGLIYATGAGAWAVPIAAVAPYILSPLALALSHRRKAMPEPSTLSYADFKDGLRFFGIHVSSVGFLHLDIMAVGIVAEPAVLAAYVIASRFSLILEAGHHLFAAAYGPRARFHMSEGQPQLAAQEYTNARVLGFLAASSAAFGFMLFGQFMLELFGGFAGAFDILMLLCAGQIALVGAGLHAMHLSMAGHLTIAMRLQLSALALFIALLVVLTPSYGAYGAALAFLSAQIALATAGLVTLRILYGIWPFTIASLVGYGLSVGSLALAGLAPELLALAGGLLVTGIVITAISERGLILKILAEVLDQLRRHAPRQR